MIIKPLSQSCTVAKGETFWRTIGQSNLVYKRLTTTKASKVWFSTHTTSLWPVEQQWPARISRLVIVKLAIIISII